MFWDKQNFDEDISCWDVSAVTDMHGTFMQATSFNSDISMWDVSRVTRMNIVFNRGFAPALAE